MLQKVEITELRGVNRNAVEGVTQVVPVELRGFDLNEAGGYYAAFAQSGTPTTSGVSGSVTAHDAYGVVLLDDETFVFNDVLVDFSSGSPAGKRVYLVPRVGVVSHARTVAEDEYDLGAFVEDVQDNFGDVFRQDSASVVVTTSSSVSSFSVQFLNDATAASGQIDAGSYKVMALWLKPTAQGLLVYDTVHATVSLSGTERIEIQSAGFLPAGYGAKTYLAKEGDGRFSQYFPNFASGGTPDNQPTVFSDGEGTFVAEIGTFASGSLSVEPTNNAIINFCSKLACVEPHNRRVWSRAAATPFVGPFIERYSPLKRVEFSYKVDAVDSDNNYFFAASGSGLISVNSASDRDFRLRARFGDGVTYTHTFNPSEFFVNGKRTEVLWLLEEEVANGSESNVGFGLGSTVDVSGSLFVINDFPPDSRGPNNQLYRYLGAMSYPYIFTSAIQSYVSNDTASSVFKYDYENSEVTWYGFLDGRLPSGEALPVNNTFGDMNAHGEYVAVGHPSYESNQFGFEGAITVHKRTDRFYNQVFVDTGGRTSEHSNNEGGLGTNVQVTDRMVVATFSASSDGLTQFGYVIRVYDINNNFNFFEITPPDSVPSSDYGPPFNAKIVAHKDEIILISESGANNEIQIVHYKVTLGSSPSATIIGTGSMPSDNDTAYVGAIIDFDFDDDHLVIPYKATDGSAKIAVWKRDSSGNSFDFASVSQTLTHKANPRPIHSLAAQLDGELLAAGMLYVVDSSDDPVEHVYKLNASGEFEAPSPSLVSSPLSLGNAAKLKIDNGLLYLPLYDWEGTGVATRLIDLAGVNYHVKQRYSFTNTGQPVSGYTGPFGLTPPYSVSFKEFSSSVSVNYREPIEPSIFSNTVLQNKYIEFSEGGLFGGTEGAIINTDIINEDGVTVEETYDSITAWKPGEPYGSGSTIKAMVFEYNSSSNFVETDVNVEFYNATLSTDAGLQVAIDANDASVIETFTDASTSTAWTPDRSGVNKGALLINDLAAANIARLNTPSTIVYSDIGYVNFASTIDQFLQLELIASDEITALVSTPGGLVVFADNEAFLVRGDPSLPQSFSAQRFSSTIGCDDGVRPGRVGGTVFPIWKGRLYSMTLGMGDVDFGSGVQEIGAPIYDPEDPFVQVIGEPRTRQVLVRTNNGRVYRYSTDAQQWMNDVFDNEDGLTFLLPNADDDGSRYLVGTDLKTAKASSGGSPYVEWQDLDLGSKGMRKQWRRVRAYFGDDYVGTPTLEYEVGSSSGTITGSEEGAGWFTFTLPNGLVNEKMARLRITMVNASFGDEFEPPVVIEFVERYSRR